MIHSFIRLILVGVASMVVAAAGLSLYLWHWLDTPLDVPQSGYTYDLQQGRALAHLSRDLNAKGLLRHPRLLVLYARFQGDARVQAGEYFLHPDITPRMLLAKLERGDVVLHQVTLVEGWTYQQALQALHREPNIRPLLKDKSLNEQMQLLALDLEHPEGWFFPDSYRFARGTSDIELLRRAHQQMRNVLSHLWDERASDAPYETPYEALIMASIIERETGAPWERHDIAGVFVRRLQKGMRLQTDPTVIYGMGDDYQGRITRADLRRPTPYNTYTISGLPPTPIALPGREAIHAALNPAPGTSLYFVARGNGTHVFSDTLAEHNSAVSRYQRQRREGYRSTLAPDVVPPAAQEDGD